MPPTHPSRFAALVLPLLVLAAVPAAARPPRAGAPVAAVPALSAPPPAASTAPASGAAGPACAVTDAGGHLVLRFGKGCTTEQLARALREAVAHPESDGPRGPARGYYRQNGLTGISHARRLGSGAARP
jgi:hypothetical protein